MGRPPRFDIYEAGIVCPTCEVALFMDITPKYVELTLTGLFGCPLVNFPPPNGTWLLTQTLPCTWYFACDPYYFTWILAADRSFLVVHIVPGLYYFWSMVMDTCVDRFDNQQLVCLGGQMSIGGVGEIRWGPTIGPQSSFIQWEVGDPCCLCQSKLFDGFTPRYVEAWVRGIQRCPAVPWPPPSGIYLLTQSAPCQWQLITGSYIFTWTLAFPLSSFEILEVPGGHLWFYQSHPKACSVHYDNHLSSACLDPNVWGWEGQTDISWGPHVSP